MRYDNQLLIKTYNNKIEKYEREWDTTHQKAQVFLEKYKQFRINSENKETEVLLRMKYNNWRKKEKQYLSLTSLFEKAIDRLSRGKYVKIEKIQRKEQQLLDQNN